MSDALERMRAATEYFNWPLGDKQTQAHIRDLVHAADEFERALTEHGELRQRCASLAAGSPPEGWEALERQVQWEIAFGAALLAVDAEFTASGIRDD